MTSPLKLALQSEQQIRAAKGLRKRKLPRIPKQFTPKKLETAYRKAITRTINRLKNTLLDRLLPRLPAMHAEANEATRVDAWPEDMAQIIDDATKIASIGDDTALIARDTFESVSNVNREALRRQFRSVAGVDVITGDIGLESVASAFVNENQILIKAIGEDFSKQVGGLVSRGLRSGERASTIAKKISGLTPKLRNRAALIARDQVNKLNGQLTRNRQVTAGITHYIWRTSGDEAVRDTHQELEGERFSWNEPPSVGHPGQDINCRCRAEPDLSDIV